MKSVLLLAVCCLGSASFAVPAPYRQIHRVFCTDPDKIEAARISYPAAFANGLIGTTYTQIAFGAPEVKDFDRYSAFVRLFQSRGVEMQVGVSTSLGHTDAWTVPGDYPKMVGANGREAKTIACPRSDAFKDHLRQNFVRYAKLKPSVIWIDDDFRMLHHPPIDFGCFCPTCIHLFSERMGVDFTLATLKQALLADTYKEDVRIRHAWRTFCREALNDLVGVVADAVHEVDDSIALGIMGCNLRGLLYATPDFKTWIKRARNSKGEVWFRHGSGTYEDLTPYSDGGFISKNIEIARLCAATEGPGVVNLTEEVTCPYTRRAKSMRLTFLEAVLNIAMAGADGTTYDAIKPNLDEQLADHAVVAEMHRHYPELNRMYELIRGKNQIGIAAPELPIDSFAVGPVKTIGEMCSAGDEKWRKLVQIGIPFTFRPRHAAARLPDDLSGDLLSLKRSLEIKDLLDHACGGRMPARIDCVVRLGMSLWEDPETKERVMIAYTLDYDDADDAVLRLDGYSHVEQLEANGTWKTIGEGRDLTLPKIPAWSPAVFRLIPKQGTL